jgi:hypothetical protein
LDVGSSVPTLLRFHKYSTATARESGLKITNTLESLESIRYSNMGPIKTAEHTAPSKHEQRPRRGSLPELKTAEKAAEKKVPTGPRANPLYKTRLCMNFQSTGSCPYTDKCQFAHGAKELEKWESWRHTQGGEAKPELDSVTSESRSRSQSMDKPNRGTSLDLDFGSPLSGSSVDFSTPILSSVSSVLDETPISVRTEFSLWSAKLDEMDHEPAFRPHLRGRAATYDSTYDNISQLCDAPTLFSIPPVLPSLGRSPFPR